MAKKIRKSPPVCLGISLVKLLLGKLRYSKQYLGQTVKIEDGQEFVIFRHITVSTCNRNENEIIFIVSFKFARLSHKANKIASIIPMLLITGFPGFNTKIYAVNIGNGYWQGMYQWKSKKHLEEYKNSFVYKMMNKRAITDTVRSNEFSNKKLTDFIEDYRN